jgi:hypothetical protein
VLVQPPAAHIGDDANPGSRLRALIGSPEPSALDRPHGKRQLNTGRRIEPTGSMRSSVCPTAPAFMGHTDVCTVWQATRIGPRMASVRPVRLENSAEALTWRCACRRPLWPGSSRDRRSSNTPPVATTCAKTTGIVQRRLAALDAEIDRLTRLRERLAARIEAPSPH